MPVGLFFLYEVKIHTIFFACDIGGNPSLCFGGGGMSNHDNACISQEEIDRTAHINMEVCATFVARMIQKYGHEVLAEIEEMKAKENTNEQ